MRWGGEFNEEASGGEGEGMARRSLLLLADLTFSSSTLLSECGSTLRFRWKRLESGRSGEIAGFLLLLLHFSLSSAGRSLLGSSLGLGFWPGSVVV